MCTDEDEQVEEEEEEVADDGGKGDGEEGVEAERDEGEHAHGQDGRIDRQLRPHVAQLVLRHLLRSEPIIILNLIIIYYDDENGILNIIL